MKKWLILIIIFAFSNAFAAHRVVNLTVDYKKVNFAGSMSEAIAVNNQIPAPLLHFKEGDTVTINVRNNLDKETALHWHGLLVPWQMDGVLGISQKGIPPGGEFHYQFKLYQSGTYWYHAHAGLQEQQGLYGAFIIDPIKKPLYRYNKDFTIVLSDWSNTHPEKILANLKKEGDYYSPNFPLQPSLQKFIHDYRKASAAERAQLFDDYKMMQQMRMSLYDFSDVAYDGFLLNGQPISRPWTALVKVGDIVRLRFIGAGGSTIFHVKIPDTTMQVVHVEGNDVKPFSVNDFTIAPGETYDVLIKIKKDNPAIIYAESIDTVGAAYGALMTSPNQNVNYKSVARFPEPLPVTRTMMSTMMGNMIRGSLPENKISENKMSHEMKMDHGMKMSDNMQMNHSMMNHSMNMPTEPSVIGDSISPPNNSYNTSENTKYKNVIAAVKTNDPNKPIADVIKMELFGYMGRYIWFINGVPEHKAHPIILQPGKRYRFVFTNTSMMHHPMHIHGHWFILRKGNNAYDPLLHTIDVPPGATITADVDTDASGQWIFHCHLLYHMMSGMARTIRYSSLMEFVPSEKIIEKTPYKNREIVRVNEKTVAASLLAKHPMAHPEGIWFANFLHVGINPATNIQKITFKGLYGSDYNKLELFTNDAEIKKGKVENADLDIFYWHLLNQFWAVKGGVNYFYRPASTPYFQPGIGLEGVLPYFIDTDLRGYFYSGSLKFDAEFSRDTQITNNFFLGLSIRSILATQKIPRATIGNGLNQMQYVVKPFYRIMPGLNIFAAFERDQYYGSFRNIQRGLGNSTGESTMTFGVDVVF